LRTATAQIFITRSAGVVVTVIDDSIVLDCYRLAAHYKQDPRIFLDMPIDEVRLHMERTAQLEQMRRREQSDD
jgi:hypothetical protein